MSETTEQAQANVCEPHHFTWTWPINNSDHGSVGVCDLCGAVKVDSPEPLRVEVQPTDVWVCLRSGVWNLTNPDLDNERIPSPTTRAILRGLLLAAIETLDDIAEATR